MELSTATILLTFVYVEYHKKKYACVHAFESYTVDGDKCLFRIDVTVKFTSFYTYEAVEQRDTPRRTRTVIINETPT